MLKRLTLTFILPAAFASSTSLADAVIGVFTPRGGGQLTKFEWEPSLSVGLNATQVKVSKLSDEITSEGFMGLVVGGGVAMLPKRYLALQLDVFYATRIFGFGTSKGFFNTWQVPLTAQIRAGNLSLGGGGYTAFWKALGKMENSGSTTFVSTDATGNNRTEFGYLSHISLTTKLGRTPVRFEFRALKSLSDVTKSSDLKGSLTEYQLLVGYDFKKR